MFDGRMKMPRSVEAMHGVEFEVLGSGIALLHIDGNHTMQIITRDRAPVIITDRRSGERSNRA